MELKNDFLKLCLNRKVCITNKINVDKYKIKQYKYIKKYFCFHKPELKEYNFSYDLLETLDFKYCFLLLENLNDINFINNYQLYFKNKVMILNITVFNQNINLNNFCDFNNNIDFSLYLKGLAFDFRICDPNLNNLLPKGLKILKIIHPEDITYVDTPNLEILVLENNYNIILKKEYIPNSVRKIYIINDLKSYFSLLFNINRRFKIYYELTHKEKYYCPLKSILNKLLVFLLLCCILLLIILIIYSLISIIIDKYSS